MQNSKLLKQSKPFLGHAEKDAIGLFRLTPLHTPTILAFSFLNGAPNPVEKMSQGECRFFFYYSACVCFFGGSVWKLGLLISPTLCVSCIPSEGRALHGEVCNRVRSLKRLFRLLGRILPRLQPHCFNPGSLFCLIVSVQEKIGSFNQSLGIG